MKIINYLKQATVGLSIGVGLLTVLTYLISPHALIPFWCLYLCIIICYFVCIFIYIFFKDKKQEIIYSLPQVIAITKICEKCIFLIEKNDLFYQDNLVSIYHCAEDGKFETFLGVGYVEIINTYGHLQVKFYSEPEQNAGEIVLGLINGSISHKTIKIRPALTRQYLEAKK